MVPGPTSRRRRRWSSTRGWRPVRLTSGSMATGTGVACASSGCRATGWRHRRGGSGSRRSGAATASAGAPKADAGSSMRCRPSGHIASRSGRYFSLVRCRHPKSGRHRIGSRIRSTVPIGALSHVSSPCRMAPCANRVGPCRLRRRGHLALGPGALPGNPAKIVTVRTCDGKASRTASATGIGAEPPQAAARCSRSRTPSQAASAGGASTQISLISGWSSSRSTANSSCAQASAPVGM